MVVLRGDYTDEWWYSPAVHGRGEEPSGQASSAVHVVGVSSLDLLSPRCQRPRAKDTRLGREVAVTVLPEHFAGDALRLARFEREAQAVAALSHPNLLAIHDYGIEQGVTFGTFTQRQ